MKFWRKKQEEDDFDDWEYPFEEKKKTYGELKKCAAAVLIFALVYGAKSADAPIGGFVGRQMQRVVTEHADISYLSERLQNYLPEQWRSGDWMEHVQDVLARPADPLQYMSAPTEGAVIGGFSVRGSGGIEYESDFGEAVRAAGAGIVKKIGTDAKLGKFMVLEHGQDIETVYGYLEETHVEMGARVAQGQEIAASGRRPADREAALYFAVWEKQIPVDPTAKLRGFFPNGGGAK